VWSDDDDEVIGGDLTAALAYVTPAGGAVVTAVAPIGLRDREARTVGFTTSLGFGRKLDRMREDPRIALAYHAREHGFASSSRFVLVQGTASYDVDPDPAVLTERIRPASTRFLGSPRTGVFWDRWLNAYYTASQRSPATPSPAMVRHRRLHRRTAPLLGSTLPPQRDVSTGSRTCSSGTSGATDSRSSCR
jgi:hypothetical protein